ncbi:DUF4479 and tRNA-binding domain-containing protein [Vagococcus coleopterorum]|uniref:DUF4479 and tRNA-binding domain-containing protein n=1 Tax=Vagococcus coleopterorum TaxID=2714946 RepID=A0A6G8AL56_9ENTE|nr:DUF4479 and tRNA-binding domain-containing protein [Vagococcus coleopterorum]QIL45710.1 DUF4479 and tRNA-binding domain-containing protein [Vagococcus coleopterorum]
MIYTYNKEAVGDVLMVTVANAAGNKVEADRKENIARIYVTESNETVGWNFFNASEVLTNLTGNGQVFPTDSEKEQLDQAITKAGFNETIADDRRPKIVSGLVKECVPHPDSDHLSVTQTEVDNGEVLQIVCGAANVREGLNVVVAKPGAMMPDGMIIWPGALRGVESLGMLCSARELAVPNAPEAKGILELPTDYPVGEAFDAANYKL